MGDESVSSPIAITPQQDAWRTIPEVPASVVDAFGPKAQVVLHRDRWRGLVPRRSGHVFAWLDGKVATATGVRTTSTFYQTLESDERGNALVIGGAGEALFSVAPTGEATALGALPEGVLAMTACWLDDGGVAFASRTGELFVYAKGEHGLEPRARFAATISEIWGLRALPHRAKRGVQVIAGMADRDGAIYAITPEGVVHELARYSDLDLAEVRLCLDETGNYMLLPEGSSIALGGSLASVDNLDRALLGLGGCPTLDTQPPPQLGATEAPPMPEQSAIAITIQPAPDAATPPSLDRLGPLTAALIRMLRAAPKRSTPDADLLNSIRSNMPTDLRAYVHAWAVHNPNNPTVYEFWMAAPRVVEHPFIVEQAGESLHLGIFASGEPIVARRGGGGPSTQVVMIDEEGIPYRYSGLEGFLMDLQMRAPDDDFELDAWMP